MNKKKLKSKLRVLEARIYRLERHIEELENHTYNAVGDDIDRLHDQVDMWADPKLKDRVEALEYRPDCDSEVEEGDGDAIWDEFDRTFHAFDSLMAGLDESQQKMIRSAQRTSTADFPAWVLGRNQDGEFTMSKYYYPKGANTAVGETVFEMDSVEQLTDMLRYIEDTLAVTGWDEEDE